MSETEDWDGAGWSPIAERIFNHIDGRDVAAVGFPSEPPVGPDDKMWVVFGDEEDRDLVGLSVRLRDVTTIPVKRTSPPPGRDDEIDWFTVGEI